MMLNNLLSSFLQVKGVEHATLLNGSGQLVAGVGKEGVVPDLHDIIHHLASQLQLAQALTSQDLHEIWFEADHGQLIEILSFDRIIVVRGESKNLQLWRNHIRTHRRGLETIEGIA
ncbi:MAG: hypothetical protein VW230_05330 [Candidatus Poseidoniales archaeon]